ncbi:Arm DNA-binding domain-containing protein [Burkholderia arboris]|uniref:Arm DNA-binding domain-containing protein n=1 Tax=Burkholderia arboris TaxID=488730 RepID=UPI002108C0CC|nr:Arm DNA-binding domain-containing protein [Burkholderia arboris]UTV53987.1 Arm DNA-binding domain-containing protein [Burkholderia arboris]
MPLTDIQVRNAKASAAPYKLTDDNGMFLLVQPNGAKYWRLSYRFLGKQKTLGATFRTTRCSMRSIAWATSPE